MQQQKMSTEENAAGRKLGTDGGEGKKGRFKVNFAVPRRLSEVPETHATVTAQEPSSPDGKL